MDDEWHRRRRPPPLWALTITTFTTAARGGCEADTAGRESRLACCCRPTATWACLECSGQGEAWVSDEV
jgi:hypothetical protein